MLKIIIYFFIICLAIGIITYIIEFMLIIAPFILAIWLAFRIYSNIYFKSKKFQSIKESINGYIKECNELNEHIEELKKTYTNFYKTDYGVSTISDNSIFRFKRKEFSKYKNSGLIYNCSLTVFKNAQEQPFKYLCKYFNISIDEDTLNIFEDILNNFTAAEQGKKLLKNKKDEVMQKINSNIPFLIKKISKKRLDKELGFEEIDFSQLYFPKYTFSYISAGGNSSMESNIIFDIDNLERFVKYLSDNIKWRKSIERQRALMATRLREKIKQRDNFTCQHCGNSTEKEENLLLEIDHIIPLSKGGQSTEDNLQTLCWKCNRSKGSKLFIEE